MKIYVYCIYFPTSDRSNPCYVGVTNNFERRLLKQHLNSKYQVGNALNKYDDWIIKKLHTCKTYEEAFKIEIEEIRNFNCVAPNGYNLTRGGENPPNQTDKKRSEESLKKMQGNQNTKGKHWKWSKESKEKIKGGKKPGTSVAMKGNQNNKGKNRSKEANTKMLVTRFRNRIKKLEQEIKFEENNYESQSDA